jgi:hypothetical protein
MTRVKQFKASRINRESGFNDMLAELNKNIELHQKGAGYFNELRQKILNTTITNELPAALRLLRSLFVTQGWSDKEAIKPFFDKWLSSPTVVLGLEAVGVFTKEQITDLFVERYEQDRKRYASLVFNRMRTISPGLRPGVRALLKLLPTAAAARRWRTSYPGQAAPIDSAECSATIIAKQLERLQLHFRTLRDRKSLETAAALTKIEVVPLPLVASLVLPCALTILRHCLSRI